MYGDNGQLHRWMYKPLKPTLSQYDIAAVGGKRGLHVKVHHMIIISHSRG
jgi:hypothetical protein